MAKPVERPIYTTKEERLAALKRSARSTNTKLGMECVTFADNIADMKRAATGIKEIDDFIGGGIPCGSVTVIWGGQGSAKTTLGLNIAATAQKEGKIVAWIALEPFPKDRAKLFGVNLEEMPVIQCPQAEQSLDIIINYAQNKLVDVMILDSIHSLAPKGMMENSKGDKSLTDETMAILARKLSEFFKWVIDPLKRSDMALLLIGQTRIKLGIVCLDDLTGGNALKHNSRLTIHTRRGAKDDSPTKKVKTPEGKTIDEVIGFPVVLKLDKVQVSGAQKELSVLNLPYYFESGFDLPKDIKIELAKEEAEIEAQTGQEAPKTSNKEPEVTNSIKVESSPSTDVIAPIKKRGRKPGSKNKVKEV